jgi:hypothetical protein
MAKEKRGGARQSAAAAPLDDTSTIETDDELDAADLDISSDDAEELPSGSEDYDEGEEEEEQDPELKAALIDYQTTAARLREEEAGASGGQEDDGDDDELR